MKSNFLSPSALSVTEYIFLILGAAVSCVNSCKFTVCKVIEMDHKNLYF